MLRTILTAMLALLLASGAFAQSGDYKIRPGDRLSIEVLEDSSLNRAILVLPDGNISFPLAGTIKASGLTTGQLRSALTAGLAPNFASGPSVFVSVQQIAPGSSGGGGGGGSSKRTIEVYLIGEVAKPGMHEVSPGTTILQFLAQSGGFTKFAAKKRLQLRRTNANGQEKVYSINFRNIEQGRDASVASARLQDGDVIVVPERRLFE